MGLIAAAWNAAGGTLASQWKEYFYVDSLPDNVLATKAEKKVKARFGGKSSISAPSRASMSLNRAANPASSTGRSMARR